MEDIFKILDSGTSQEKIETMESLAYTDNIALIKKIIQQFNDDDITVRGEAFSSLILNKNQISELLTESLKSTSKNVRGFVSLVLANRNDKNSISEIIKLTKDESSMVRSCALGALGHLRAIQAKDAIEVCLTDSNLEVKKSALQAAIYINDVIPQQKINEISKDKDPELERLLLNIKKMSGPEGI